MSYLGGEGCVVFECINVCPCGIGSSVQACVYDQCPVIGEVNGYDGVEGSCAGGYMFERSGGAYGSDALVEVAFYESDG